MPPPQSIKHESDETIVNNSPQHDSSFSQPLHKKQKKGNKSSTFRVYCKARTHHSLAIYDGKVVLAPVNPSDPLQHWIKYENFETGYPSIALINKATGQAIKHSIGVTYPVQLKKYNPDELDKSILWNVNKLDDGYRASRAIDNTHLNLDAAMKDIKKHGGVHDVAANIVLWDWHGGKNQRWTIISYCTDYSLAVYEGKFVLAPANTSDPLQHWIKDENVGINVKDEEGHPSFALVNKATSQAIKHTIGVTNPLLMKKYNPDKLDKSALWTMGNNLDEGYRTVSAVDNTRLKLDAAFRDVKKIWWGK